MNSYKIDNLYIGMSESFEVEITEDMMKKFAEISGDTNPLHNSDEFAVERGFKSKVVFGMLCSCLFSTLAGVYLPGKYCLLHEVLTKFKRPVFIGDRLTVRGEISEISEGLSRITVKASIKNQRRETVNSAVIKLGVIE